MTEDRNLPDDYPRLLEDLKRTVAEARWRAQRVVNTELVGLYWRLGRTILERQQAVGWGRAVVDRLSADLRAEFPTMKGLSRSNLFYMRAFAAAWPEEAVVQRLVGQLPWGHVTVLLDKLDEKSERDWYAAAAVDHGWSRNVLLNQIMNGLHTRTGAAPSNFPARLPAADSELAQQLTRDPYVLDFLDLTGTVAERDFEQALMTRLQDFLLELGHGFAFVGRQHHFTVDGDDFYIDLLFFNWVQSRFVVLELKVGAFAPEHAGQLGFYVSWVDANLRNPDQHAPTIGILLCAGRNDSVVRYALAGSNQPLAVADYTYDTLPRGLREAIPSEADLSSAADAAYDDLRAAHDQDHSGPPG
ncbi:PDDEXK nuclease domain-containing protein [Occultella kanbiaonis]|uniref:PDDEXK nuclease domain-containing protein n=1 Tax=Occultella kanbiaonis TaxID=2675754 RepID=UPI0012B89B1E|nr:PDDEXK nuclease domain-containing protein [Occultella kanbiaonis]